jgi:predicted dienelactone hydrolase
MTDFDRIPVFSYLVQTARDLPVPAPAPTVSMDPITLPAPDRGLPLKLRVTAAATGTELPIVLISHGGGASRYIPSRIGYQPLVDFYAARGFAVVQPTHLSSRSDGLGLRQDLPGWSLFWRSRIDDFKQILDQSDAIEVQAPIVAGRLDWSRVAIVGHSAGGNTASILLGARGADPVTGEEIDLREPRISAGVLLASTGTAEGLSAPIRQRFPELAADFSHMTTRTLVVHGDQDGDPRETTRGASWHAEPYHLSPGADALVTLPGAKHFLGGVMGYDLAESDDDDPDRLAVTQAVSWAYLRSALNDGDPAWAKVTAALTDHDGTLANIETK